MFIFNDAKEFVVDTARDVIKYFSGDAPLKENSKTAAVVNGTQVGVKIAADSTEEVVKVVSPAGRFAKVFQAVEHFNNSSEENVEDAKNFATKKVEDKATEQVKKGTTKLVNRVSPNTGRVVEGYNKATDTFDNGLSKGKTISKEYKKAKNKSSK